MTLAVDAALFIVALAVALAAVRAIIGPTLADRAMALDLMSSLGVSLLVVHAVREGQPALADAALALAAVGLLGVVALALYIERRSKGSGW